MKKIVFLIIFTFYHLINMNAGNFAYAQASEATTQALIFFEQPGCPDCAKQKEFLTQLQLTYPDFTIESHNILDQESVVLLQNLAQEHQIDSYRLMVPTIFVAGHLFQGYSEQEHEQIRALLQGKQIETKTDIITVPFIGEINFAHWSLFFTTTVIASLDGLNVCSIGAIVLILMLVVTLNSRKKTILYGSLFILTSAIVYGSLVFIWTTAISAFISHLALLKKLIGLTSLGGGIFFTYKFYEFLKYGASCQSSGNSIVAKASQKVQTDFNSKKGTFFLSTSVIVFAIIITLVELPCSIALPVIYGGILAEKQLPLLTYSGYILLYLFYYMLIEIVIFLIAVVTKEVYFAQSKALAWIYLFGALVLLLLGANYLLPF